MASNRCIIDCVLLDRVDTAAVTVAAGPVLELLLAIDPINSSKNTI